MMEWNHCLLMFGSYIVIEYIFASSRVELSSLADPSNILFMHEYYRKTVSVEGIHVLSYTSYLVYTWSHLESSPKYCLV